MSDLTPRELELVALGAALGSNCVSCVEYHIAESRKAGLADTAIHAAVQHADKIRQVPARKALQAALNLLPSAAADVPNTATGEGCGCGESLPAAAKVETSKAQPHDMMMGMMAKMMDACGSHGQPAGSPITAAAKPAAQSATNAGCGCG